MLDDEALLAMQKRRTFETTPGEGAPRASAIHNPWQA